jgi:HlyD family secretion protein
MSDSSSDTARAAALRETLARASAGSRRTWIWALLVVLLAGGAGAWYVRAQPTDTGPQYRIVQVETGTLTVSVSATGEIQSLTEVNVGTEISGIVDKVLVDFNSPVAVGQLLATINTDKLKAQADQARAAVAANRARQQQVEATRTEGRLQLDRLLEVHVLSGGKVPSQQELDAQRAVVARAEADLASAAAQVQQSDASLAAIDTDLRRAAIRSPIRGIVLDRQVDPGQTVAASFQTPTLFTLAEDLARMKLMVDVDEADVGTVRVGQRASFHVDAYPTRTFESTVVEVRSTPTKSNGVVTYQTVLSVDNSALLLKPGMTATAEIVVDQAANAVLVPNAALRFTPPVEPTGGGRSILSGPPASGRVTTDDPATRVWTLVDGQATPIDVIVGASDGQSTQVTGSVRPGDAVIVDVVPERE